MADTGPGAGSSAGRVARFAPVIDGVFIVLFVILGRKSHHEDGSFLAGTVRVAAPFLVGAAVGWVASKGLKRPLDPTTGVQVWLSTVVVGMVLRRFVFHKGTALPFIIVATLFTLMFLVGWRIIWNWLAARRHP